MFPGALVAVVDDDESVREALPDLLVSLGFSVASFSSGEAFLASDSLAQTKCLVLDISMPGMTGLDLQRELMRRGRQIPIVFITAYADEVVRSRVIKLGATACLFKPFGEAGLLAALHAALGAG